MLDALSFRAVADDLKVTRTAPIYYFGSREGLLAAIAEQGFCELASRLRQQREAGDGSERTLKRLGLTYAAYAFQNAELYRVMHASDLWRAAIVRVPNKKRSDQEAAAKAKVWIEKAAGSRDAAFEEFVIAIRNAEAAGHLQREAPEDVAHLVTAIIDGFLFHHVQEHEATDLTTEALLKYVQKLLDLGLSGLCVSIGSREEV